ncbi:uncharacterized protein LOC134854398 [Symsagittifera roscoffensis]|uniref:uncharacterized protein LOC134854398 n=1 Tax=Symsagittifera roscoffensis TaxID=84072 RepID=UPI00307C4B6D
MLRVKYQFTSYIPLGVIVGQVLLIFLLVFFTEKFFVHRDHGHSLPKHTERFSALKAMELTSSAVPRRNLNDDLNYGTEIHQQGGGAMGGGTYSSDRDRDRDRDRVDYRGHAGPVNYHTYQTVTGGSGAII